MKKINLLVALLAAFNALAQIDSSATDQISYKNTNLLKLNLLTPGAEFEYGVSQNRTIVLTTSFRYMSIKEGLKPTESFTFVLPYLSYRNYYNIEKRQSAGKRADNFNANYIAIQCFYKPQLGKYDQRLGWGASWGIQRNYGRLFHLGLELGAGYGPNGFYLNAKNELFPHADIQLGFMFR